MTSMPMSMDPPRAQADAVDVKFLKFLLIINGLVPAAILIWDAANNRLGANPVNFAIRTTGILTLIFLPLSLLITPLRKITGLQWLFHFRRALGLYAFFYGMSHFLLFFALDRGLSVPDTFSEMIKRKYLFVGSAGLLFMVPLALTSFNSMVKRLGAKRWQALHRLAYLSAAAGALHYYMLVKADTTVPIAFMVVIGVLLTYRVATWVVKTSARSRTAAAVSLEAGTWKGQLRVAKITQETADVRTFQLVNPLGGLLPFSYLPGQHLSLTLNIEGKKVYRSYTIASAPGHPEACELTIKRDANGTASKYMHDVVREGTVLNVAAAGGKFTFVGEGEHIALLAAGVGITPLMSIIRYLDHIKWPGQIHLVYSNKSEADIIFRAELMELAARNPNLHITHTLTRGGPEWAGRTGRINAELLREVVPELGRMPVYVCGPTEMIKATKDLLTVLQLPADQIRSESFGARPILDAALAAIRFQVTFAKSKKQVDAPANQPLLEVAEAHDVPVDFECRSGNCGRCKCPMISGSVEMANTDALTNADRKAKIILMCQAMAREDVVIDA